MTPVSIGGQPASAASGHGYGQHSNSLLPNSQQYDESPVRFRNLNKIYEMTKEIELDSDVEALLAIMEEPTCYKDAAGDENWEAAMRSELQSISKNRTWELVKLPQGQRPIGLKWVFKLKRNANGEVIKHKARLVEKGYVQKQGVDFEEVFAPNARLDTVRMILAIAANRGWQVH